MKVPELDYKDKKIIEALRKDGRAQIKTISKLTGIQRDSVHYRLKKMLSSGVIKHIIPIMDPAKMGYPVYIFVNMVIKDFRKESRQRFEAHLKEHPYVTYSARISGKYHYIFSIAAKTLEQFDDTLGEILNRFPDFVKDYDASTIIEEFKTDTFTGLIEEDGND